MNRSRPHVGSHSCIYTGTVAHSRFFPKKHSFKYRSFMMYLDLSEVRTIFERYWLWANERARPIQFRRSDHYGEATEDLSLTIKKVIAGHGHNPPDGRICLLTHLRVFGYIINPVSFYYCYDTAEQLQYVVAEVHNTPWGECHCYVIPKDSFTGRGDGRRTDKEFHVSPFMGMQQTYGWKITSPSSKLSVCIENYSKETGLNKPLFNATLKLTRREISSWNLSLVLVTYPLSTIQVVIKIYWQATLLWLKGFTYYRRPRREKTERK